MVSSLWFDKIHLGKFSADIEGCQVTVLLSIVFLYEDIFYRADPDKIPHYAAFHPFICVTNSYTY